MRSYLLSAIFILTGTVRVQAQEVLHAAAGGIITVQSGAIVYVNGGIGLADGSSLKNNGTITVAGNLPGAADMIDVTQAGYYYGSGKFVFTGTKTQKIKSINQLERIEIENAGLDMLSDIRSDTWYLKTGKVNTAAFVAIASSPAENAVEAAASNAGFTNAWFNGKLRRYITPVTVKNYLFPVGNAVKVNTAEMENLSADPLNNVQYITASFGVKPGTDAGLNVSENTRAYTTVSSGGVWYLAPDVLPTAGRYDLKVFFNGFSDLFDNNFGMLRRADTSANAAEWSVPVNSVLPPLGAAGRMVTDGYARRIGISTFSQWGIGNFLSALPLQLIKFTAVKKEKTVVLEWITANEINLQHFELYGGGQPVNLQLLTNVASSATGHIYTYTDTDPLDGYNYYRLKTVDNDNSYKLSRVVQVKFEDETIFTVYPNPVTNSTLFVTHNGDVVKSVNLIAVDGKQVAADFIILTKNSLKVQVPYYLAKGSYIVQLQTASGNRNAKIIVE